MHEHDKMWEDLGLDVQLHHRLMESIGKNYKDTVLNQKNRPEGMSYFDGVIHASHGDRVKELMNAKEKGKKIAGTFCIYVPEEIAMAVDVIPLPLCGGTNFSVPYAEKLFPRDICPLVKSTLGLAFSKLVATGGALWVVIYLTASRTMQVELAVRLPYARGEGGTAASFVRDAKGFQRAIALIITLVLALAYGPIGLVALAIAEAVTWVYGEWCRKRLAGITGDLLGAANEIVETVLLLLHAAPGTQLLSHTGWHWAFTVFSQ